MPKIEDFTNELNAQFTSAKLKGLASIEVNAGVLHRLIGGYPPKEGEHHAMPTCCLAMWNCFGQAGDAEVSVPPKKKGASLTLRYRIPRR